MKENEKLVLVKDLSTGSGMWGLWDYYQYKNINSYDDWEKLFCEDEDILKQIDMSKFAPIYTNSDGCFQFRIKINELLDERESKYVLAKSDEYLLETDGTVVLSGIEYIGGDVRDDECIRLELSKGNYSIVIYLIEWDAEPNMKSEDGTPLPDALPDFIVSIQPTNDLGKSYRKVMETFNPL